jgi:hypothetical protein
MKATEILPPYAKRQLVNYLRATPVELGLLLHFGPKAKFWQFVDAKRARPVQMEQEGNTENSKLTAIDSV